MSESYIVNCRSCGKELDLTKDEWCEVSEDEDAAQCVPCYKAERERHMEAYRSSLKEDEQL